MGHARVSVYRFALGDCTMGGITSRKASVVVAGPGVVGASNGPPDLVLLPGAYRCEGWRAVPTAVAAAHLVEVGKRAERSDCMHRKEYDWLDWAKASGIDWPEPDKRWFMSGGNLIGSSDSRWREAGFDYISVHDRTETRDMGGN